MKETCAGGTIGLATKWLRILSLGGIDKIRNHLVANSIEREKHLKRQLWKLISGMCRGILGLFAIRGRRCDSWWLSSRYLTKSQGAFNIKSCPLCGSTLKDSTGTIDDTWNNTEIELCTGRALFMGSYANMFPLFDHNPRTAFKGFALKFSNL